MADSNVIRLREQPVLRVIDGISRESENVAWLRQVGPIARRMNEEAMNDDGGDDEAA